MCANISAKLCVIICVNMVVNKDQLSAQQGVIIDVNMRENMGVHRDVNSCVYCTVQIDVKLCVILCVKIG